MNGKTTVETILSAIGTVRNGIQELESGGGDYYLRQLGMYARALFDRFAPFKVGDRVRLRKTPEINVHDSWGWMGSKHFLVEGREGVVREVDYHVDRNGNEGFFAMVEWDNQTWIDHHGKEQAVVRPGLFCHGESWLERVEPTITMKRPPFCALLFCPRCQKQHVDEDEWKYRPHHTHLCLHCKFEWRVEPYCVGVSAGTTVDMEEFETRDLGEDIRAPGAGSVIRRSDG